MDLTHVMEAKNEPGINVDDSFGGHVYERTWLDFSIWNLALKFLIIYQLPLPIMYLIIQIMNPTDRLQPVQD